MLPWQKKAMIFIMFLDLKNRNEGKCAKTVQAALLQNCPFVSPQSYTSKPRLKSPTNVPLLLSSADTSADPRSGAFCVPILRGEQF